MLLSDSSRVSKRIRLKNSIHISLDAMLLDRTRRNRLFGAAGFAVFALFQLYTARHAQITHTVIPSKGSWYTFEVGYFLALCSFAMAAYLVISAFRGSDEQKR
jgi:hypothetical protein